MKDALMEPTDQPVYTTRNRVLQRLLAVEPGLQPISLEAFEAGAALDQRIGAGGTVFFPETAIVSATLYLQTQAEPVSVVAFSTRALVGVLRLLGQQTTPVHPLVVVGGQMSTMPAGALADAVEKNEQVFEIIGSYLSFLFFQIARDTHCVTSHDPVERLARRLLEAEARDGNARLRLSRSQLALLAGGDPAGIEGALDRLTQARLLGIEDSYVTIANRDVILEASCDCDAATEREFRRAMGLDA